MSGPISELGGHHFFLNTTENAIFTRTVHIAPFIGCTAPLPTSARPLRRRHRRTARRDRNNGGRRGLVFTPPTRLRIIIRKTRLGRPLTINRLRVTRLRSGKRVLHGMRGTSRCRRRKLLHTRNRNHRHPTSGRETNVTRGRLNKVRVPRRRTNRATNRNCYRRTLKRRPDRTTSRRRARHHRGANRTARTIRPINRINNINRNGGRGRARKGVPGTPIRLTSRKSNGTPIAMSMRRRHVEDKRGRLRRRLLSNNGARVTLFRRLSVIVHGTGRPATRNWTRTNRRARHNMKNIGNALCTNSPRRR